MRTKIQKWGNSLAVRIPKPLAKEIQIGEGRDMEIFSGNGRIVLAPISRAYELKALLSQIKKENLHSELETGAPLSKEVW